MPPVKKRKPAGLADERDKIVTTTLLRASRIYSPPKTRLTRERTTAKSSALKPSPNAFSNRDCSNNSPDQPTNSWLTGLVCLLLAALVWAVFGQTIHFDFVNFDDPTYVYNNYAVMQGLSCHSVIWLFTHSNGSTWFPLTDISHQLDWQLYGLNAGGHHLTNVLLHVATTILLFFALRELTGTLWRAAFVAAVFGIHPLRVESVAWVVERKDVLSGLFFMLTLLAWARHVKKLAAMENRETDDNIFSALAFRRWTSGYILALVFCALGLMSKSMLVTLPLVLLLLDYWPLQRWPVNEPWLSRRQLKATLDLLLEKIPFLIFSTVTCAVTMLTQDKVVSVMKNLTIPWRIGNVLQTYVDYLMHLIWPVGLTVAYSHNQTYPFLWKICLSVIILIAITTAVIAGRRRHSYLVTGWLWYLVVLLPVADIIQVSCNARADRYTYLPQIGLVIMLAWGATEFSARWRNRKLILGGAAAAVIAALAADAYVQTTYWQNSFSLWTRALACTEENSFAHNTIGSALAAQGKWNAAIQHFQQSLRISPDVSATEANLGVALVNTGQRAEAIPHFQRALQLDSENANAHCNFADALASEGKNNEAIRHFEQALKFQPNYPEADYGLGLALAREGKWDDARGHYERAMHTQLDAADTRYISGVALATQKQWFEASQLYEAALQLKPNFAEAHYRLGIALDAQGKSAEALSHLQQALSLATRQGNSTLAESIRNEIKNHEAAQQH